VPVENKEWSLRNDEEFDCDIAVNIVPDGLARQGKGSYKLLKYMSLGIPSVTSWTANEYTKDTVTCLVADSENDWYACLLELITNADTRKTITTQGIKESHKFITERVGERYIQILKSI